MNRYMKWPSVLVGLFLTGCQIPAAMIATSVGAMPVSRYEVPKFDVPPQVIYAIDQNRYVTLENYSKCDGTGIMYYNDAGTKIRTRIQYGSPTFLGQLNLDGNPNVLAFPDAPGPTARFCGDRGCKLAINYSLDGGRTFDRFHPWRLPSGDNMRPDVPYQETKNITVTLKGNQLYLADKTSAIVYTLKKSLDGSESVEGGPAAVPNVRTSSGQDRFICDDSIRPKEVTK
jgi:hypothetical protein